MGAFKVEVMLHDRELEEFVRQALADELSSEARYVAERMCDEIPELRPGGGTCPGCTEDHLTDQHAPGDVAPLTDDTEARR